MHADQSLFKFVPGSDMVVTAEFDPCRLWLVVVRKHRKLPQHLAKLVDLRADSSTR